MAQEFLRPLGLLAPERLGEHPLAEPRARAVAPAARGRAAERAQLPQGRARRARAAGLSIIPTTTGAARATSLVIPEVKGKIDGVALRVPTANVSLVDLTCIVTKPTDADGVNAAFRQAASGPLKGVLAVSDEPLVSIDFNGDLHSSTLDAASTNVIDGTLVHVSSWYDNEMGYSARCVDLLGYMAQ